MKLEAIHILVIAWIITVAILGGHHSPATGALLITNYPQNSAGSISKSDPAAETIRAQSDHYQCTYQMNSGELIVFHRGKEILRKENIGLGLADTPTITLFENIDGDRAVTIFFDRGKDFSDAILVNDDGSATVEMRMNVEWGMRERNFKAMLPAHTEDGRFRAFISPDPRLIYVFDQEKRLHEVHFPLPLRQLVSLTKSTTPPNQLCVSAVGGDGKTYTEYTPTK